MKIENLDLVKTGLSEEVLNPNQDWGLWSKEELKHALFNGNVDEGIPMQNRSASDNNQPELFLAIRYTDRIRGERIRQWMLKKHCLVEG